MGDSGDSELADVRLIEGMVSFIEGVWELAL